VSLIDDPPEEEASSRTGMYVGIAAALIVAAAGAWFFLVPSGPPPATEPVTPTTRAAAPAPRPAPAKPAAPSAPTTPARRAPREAPEPAPVETPEAAPEPTGGILRVQSDVPGAMVFLDREYLGTTPIDAKGLTPGSHKLNVSATGYDGFSDTVTLSADPVEVMVQFKQVKLDETVAVVHKHGMGSCEGRLRADPGGLRYETSDRGDAFTIKFADVEAFEVDYLKKNLRLKLRRGKTYNFTDKNDNADMLFVFHKNVEGARARLARGDAPAPQ
jgi:hypothetical protein